MAGLGTSFVDTLLEKIVGNSLARRHRQSMVNKRQAAHLAKLLRSSDPEDVIIGLMGAAQAGAAPSLNRTLSTISSTCSIETKHTRSNTQPSTCTPHSIVQTSPTSSTTPSIFSAPPGYVRQIKDRQPIFYSTQDITARVPLADRSSYASIDTPVKNDIFRKTAWTGYGPNPPVDFPVHPDEMTGEGCYRVSGHASGNALVECLKDRVYPLGPLITNFIGDVEIRGHNFTYDELMREIYHTTSARKYRDPDVPFHQIQEMKDGCVVQQGFPCQPKPLGNAAPRVLGHKRSEWYAQDPTAREFNFIHIRYHPEPCEPLEVKYIAVPRKGPIVKGRADSNATKPTADEQHVELPVHVRFAKKPEILGNISTVHKPNNTKRNQNPHNTGATVKLAKMPPRTDKIVSAAIQTGGHITKLGTAPHHTHNTPSLSSNEHPLFGRPVQKDSLEPHLEQNDKRLTDVQEVEEDTDQDAGPWEDICVEKNPDTNDGQREARNTNQLVKPKYRPARALRPNNARTMSDNRPVAQNKSQQLIPACVQARNQAQARKHAQDHTLDREPSRVRLQVNTLVRDKIDNPLQSEFSVQARSHVEEQIKRPIDPTSIVHTQKQVQVQIEAPIMSAVGEQAPSQLLGDEVRDRVLSQFQSQVPPAVQPPRLPHHITVQGFHRSFNRIRIPAVDEDASSDALESCS